MWRAPGESALRGATAADLHDTREARSPRQRRAGPARNPARLSSARVRPPVSQQVSVTRRQGSPLSVAAPAEREAALDRRFGIIGKQVGMILDHLADRGGVGLYGLLVEPLEPGDAVHPLLYPLGHR